MSIRTLLTFICDGCGGEASNKKEMVAHYEIAKSNAEDRTAPTKYIRDYCARCAPLIRNALAEGAFKEKRK